MRSWRGKSHKLDLPHRAIASMVWPVVVSIAHLGRRGPMNAIAGIVAFALHEQIGRSRRARSSSSTSEARCSKTARRWTIVPCLVKAHGARARKRVPAIVSLAYAEAAIASLRQLQRRGGRFALVFRQLGTYVCDAWYWHAMKCEER